MSAFVEGSPKSIVLPFLEITMKTPWVRNYFDAWSLGLEASSVILLRALKIAAGGAEAEAESRLMFSEKIDAGWTIQRKAMTRGLGLTAHGATAMVLAHYRRRIRSNQRRLEAR
jgi:hypothetical protein